MQGGKEYGKQSYWEERFKEEEQFEWVEKPDVVVPAILWSLSLHTEATGRNGDTEDETRDAGRECETVSNLKEKEEREGEDGSGSGKGGVRILMAGCGNSALSQMLYDAGYTNIVNVDFSSVAIEKMREKHSRERPLMQWRVGDLLAMDDMPDTCFDVVIDKCTIDAISCGPDGNVRQAVSEFRRLLTPGGLYLLLSYSRFRMDDFLEEEVAYTVRDLCADVVVSARRWEMVGEEELAACSLPEEGCKDENWRVVRCVPFFSTDIHDNGSLTNPSNVNYLFVLRRI